MKKIILIITLLMTTLQVYPASFTVFGKVYNEDGSIGTELTANSFCGLKTYRKSIPDEIGIQNIGPDNNCPQKIFPAYYNGQTTTAYFNSDVGSYNWTTVVGVGQYVVSVVEVYEGQFSLCAWNNASYVGARIKVLSQQNIDDGGTDMPDIRLEPVPAPQPQKILSDSVILTWTGLSYDPDNLVTGYTVYRSTEPGGAGGYTQLTITASQIKGGLISFTDTGLNQSNTYYYKIAVNFEWGGGNDAPDYFVSNAISSTGSPVNPGSTSTMTPTETLIPYYTTTETITVTHTSTLAFTKTNTETFTITITCTPSMTETSTLTLTQTITPTATQTITRTYTETPSFTPTLTPTKTHTRQFYISDSLKNKLLHNRIVVLNNPVKDGNLRIALYNENNGIVQIFLYNINGELVMKIKQEITGGFTILQEKIRKAPGAYIIRAMIKTSIETINLPLQKVGVIK